jgi:hypothetical protein
MAQESIFVGAAANDDTGDTLRNAMLKVNSNFTELYTLTNGASASFTVPFGGTVAVSATNSTQFAHSGQVVEFAITTTHAAFNQVQIILSAPSILLYGAVGPVVIQRVIGGVATDIHAIMVSYVDNGYHMVYEDTHGQAVGTEIIYKLINKTGSGGTAGSVLFETTYGFQFGGREV